MKILFSILTVLASSPAIASDMGTPVGWALGAFIFSFVVTSALLTICGLLLFFFFETKTIKMVSNVIPFILVFIPTAIMIFTGYEVESLVLTIPALIGSVVVYLLYLMILNYFVKKYKS